MERERERERERVRERERESERERGIAKITLDGSGHDFTTVKSIFRI